MLTEYITAALRHARYKLLEDGSYFGEMPELRGPWAGARSLEACREELREVIEAWIMVGLRKGEVFPEFDGLTPAVFNVGA